MTATPADLQVTSVGVPNTEHDSGEPTTVTYTVINERRRGMERHQELDRQHLLQSEPTFNAGQVTLLASVVHDNTSGLGAGQSYTTTATITPPAGTSGPYYIYVITNNDPQNYKASRPDSGRIGNDLDALISRRATANDPNGVVYEGTLTNNNIGQGTIGITYKEAALTVNNMTVSILTPSAGETVTVSWTVTNTGNRATRVSNGMTACICPTAPRSASATSRWSILTSGRLRVRRSADLLHDATETTLICSRARVIPIRRRYSADFDFGRLPSYRQGQYRLTERI